jgi:Mg2+/Co2+ transporter CorB
LSDIPTSALIGALIFLVLLSAFFSAAEIAMISLDRHLLRHQERSGHRGARLAARLLERPDRLIGIVLLGSNSINALFSALTTYTVFRLFGDPEGAIGIATVIITLAILILTDLAPKTLSALHPEAIAYPSSYVLTPLLKIAYPVVWTVNALANGLLRLFGVSVATRRQRHITPEELRTLLLETGNQIPKTHQDMLLAILDLEKATVDDVMVPRARIQGLDISGTWEEVRARLPALRHTQIPVYRGSLDQIEGMLHVSQLLRPGGLAELDLASLLRVLAPAYYIPAGTRLNQQLLYFQKQRQSIGLVVDEYGVVKGLVGIEEILEEIVGQFARPIAGLGEDAHAEPDGSYLVRGDATVRELNRKLGWSLPTDGPKTLNGLILERLETIPAAGTSLTLAGYQLQVLQRRGAAVSIARVRPPAGPAPDAAAED